MSYIGNGPVSVVTSADSVQSGPFGESISAELTPFMQRKWVYGLNQDIDTIVEHDGGTVTVTDSVMTLATSATTSSIATYQVATQGAYRPGQGVVARFTAFWTTSVAASEQIIGLGDEEHGLFFGYNGTSFGIMYRAGGQVDTRTLTVTAGGSAGNITITLNSGAVVVALGAGDTTRCDVATKIAQADFSTAGGGWLVYAAGDRVIFTAIGTETRGGTYSFVDTDTTGAAGSIVQTLSNTAATDTWIAQASWNGDPADGTSKLPSLDKTKFNVFAIHYPWLGSGGPTFYIKDPTTGEFVLVHRIPYENAYTVPWSSQPDISLFASVDNKATTTNLQLHTCSGGQFNVGLASNDTGLAYTLVGSGPNVSNSYLNGVTFRVKTVFNSRTSHIRIKIGRVSLANANTTKILSYRILKNAYATAANALTWTDIEANGRSSIEYTTTSFTPSNGQVIGGGQVSPSSSEVIQLTTEARSEILSPGDMITFAPLRASGTEPLEFSVQFIEFQ